MNLRNNYLAIMLGCGVAMLSGCDMLGIETPAKQAAAAEAEGRAVGSACRHAGRAIEDCFVLNPKALKSAVFAGWKDMNDYMTKNKIDIVEPQIAKLAKEAAKEKEAADAQHDEAANDKPADKPATKPYARDKAGASHDKAHAQAAPDITEETSTHEAKPKVASVADDAVAAARQRAHTP